MAFFKAVKLKRNGKWYPQAVQVDRPYETDELADRLARESTVSRADVYAVLKGLPEVMAEMMDNGRSVRMEGLGTFRYTINARRNGVDTEDEVDAAQVKAVRVRFSPDNRRLARKLAPDTIRWTRVGGKAEEEAAGGGDPKSEGEL